MQDSTVTDYITLGEAKGIIQFTADRLRVEYVAQKKSRAFKDRPEEQVQVETYCRLILEYGYPAHRVQNFVAITMGSEKKKPTSWSTTTMQSQTSGIRNLIMRDFLNQPIVLPSLKMQARLVAHIQAIRAQAQQLQLEAAQGLAQAKAQVERLIVGNAP
jgi:hypothetical protein